MEVYLISNNLYENNLSFANLLDIETKKMARPLSIEGENLAKSLSVESFLENTGIIYSSLYSASLASAKYLAERVNHNIIVDENLNDCKVGNLGNKNLKMVKFMQNHDFNIKLNNGESLNEVGIRMDKIMKKITNISTVNKIAVFTHRRSILGFLINYGKAAYNLDDDLVIEYNDKVIYDETEKDIDIIRLKVENRKIVDIDVIDY